MRERQNPDWNGALKQVACLNTNKYLGYDDWCLPNINELENLINTDNANSIVWLTAQGFRNVMMEFYWSSTTDSQRPEQAWVVVMHGGNVLARDKYPGKYAVWPVRSAKSVAGGAVSPTANRPKVLLYARVFS